MMIHIKNLRVLSLFDGMSGGQIALNYLGIKDYTYYASEINENSIKITQKNYPDTIQLGDVTLLKEQKLKEIGDIDLLMGGSPCTNLTITVCNNYEHNQGLLGKESKLFFEYIRIKKLIKPKYFLLENVASMTTENKDIITKYMGVEPIKINSDIVSAQDRERLYWTNIPLNKLPVSKGLVLKDIMQQNVEERYFYKQDFDFNGWDKRIIATLHLKCHDIGKRVYNPNMTCATLTGVRGGYQEKKVYDGKKCRKIIPLEYERLQNVPEGYTEGVANSARYCMLGDGWTINVIKYIFQNLVKEYIHN